MKTNNNIVFNLIFAPVKTNAFLTKKVAIKLLLILTPFVLIFYNSEYPVISQRDEYFIQKFAKKWQLPQLSESIHKNFDSELSFISRVQDSVLNEIKGMHKEVIQNFGSIAHYYKIKKGSCYDRAVLMEKIFSYYGFAFRHIYTFVGEADHPIAISDFFKKGTPSHALLEVKTKKGWLVLGTNSNWTGFTEEKEVLNLKQLRKKLIYGKLKLAKKATVGTPFFIASSANFKVVYGLYSRHGNFFNHSVGKNNFLGLVNVPSILPDYNARMLFYNF